MFFCPCYSHTSLPVSFYKFYVRYSWPALPAWYKRRSGWCKVFLRPLQLTGSSCRYACGRLTASPVPAGRTYQACLKTLSVSCALKDMIYPKGHVIPQRAWFTPKGMLYPEGSASYPLGIAGYVTWIPCKYHMNQGMRIAEIILTFPASFIWYSFILNNLSAFFIFPPDTIIFFLSPVYFPYPGIYHIPFRFWQFHLFTHLYPAIFF